MSRFNITIILACVLLAMLLWIVRATVGEWTDPEPLIVLEEATEPVEFDPTLPVISSGGELAAWLGDNDLGDTGTVQAAREWRAARGYPTTGNWLDNGVAPLADFSADLVELDDAALLSLAGAGNSAAALELGERSRGDNPLDALSWFDQAIVNGSLFAMLRTADLLTTLADPALRDFQTNAVWQQALDMLADEQPPLERALAWNIAAVIAGGYSIIDAQHADRISGLVSQLDTSAIDRACELAQSYVLDTAMARRAQGGAVFSTERSLLGVSVINPAQVLPCDVPVQPLVDLGDCITQPFVGPGPQLWQLYFCPSV